MESLPQENGRDVHLFSLQEEEEPGAGECGAPGRGGFLPGRRGAAAPRGPRAPGRGETTAVRRERGTRRGTDGCTLQYVRVLARAHAHCGY